jgi:hypothetical protein
MELRREGNEIVCSCRQELREFSCDIFVGQEGSERGKRKNLQCSNIRYQEPAVEVTVGWGRLGYVHTAATSVVRRPYNSCRIKCSLTFHTWQNATSTVRQSEISRNAWKLRLHFILFIWCDLNRTDVVRPMSLCVNGPLVFATVFSKVWRWAIAP